MIDDYKLAQGTAKPVEAGSAEERKDLEDGVTNPNLHRRIDNECTPLGEGEIKPDTYELTVQGVSSYRTVRSEYHDEESTTTEIP